MIKKFLYLLFFIGFFSSAFFLTDFYAKNELKKMNNLDCPAKRIEGVSRCKKEDVMNYIIHPLSTEWNNIVKKNFDTDEIELIKQTMRVENMPNPHWIYHPRLLYVKGRANNKFYTTGQDGVRSNGENRECTNLLLNDKNIAKIFIFGGSTAEGHGLPGFRTISYFLNQMVKSNGYRVFNFGTGAYDFKRSSDYISYLLKRGHKPDIIIFFGGLNQITSNSKSPYRQSDKLIFHGWRDSLKDSGLKYLKKGDGQGLEDSFTLLQRIKNLNIVKFFKYKNTTEEIKSKKIYNISPFEDNFDPHFHELVFLNSAEVADKNKVFLTEQLLKSYVIEDDFVTKISQAYGADFLNIFQPFGLIDTRNPMKKEGFSSAAGFEYYKYAYESMKKFIQLSDKNIIDGTKWLAENSDNNNYIDLNHYSGVANKIIAEKIFDHLKQQSKYKESKINSYVLDCERGEY